MADSMPEADPNPSMRHFDVAVIGAGPAGLAAAGTAAAHGASVLLLDEQHSAGGQIYRNLGAAGDERIRVLGADYADGRYLLGALDEPGVCYQARACVWQLTAERELFYSTPEGSARVRADELIIATGALERPMPVPGWTLPGVMNAGAAQSLLKSGLRPGGRVVLAGSGPLLLLLAQQLWNAGAEVAAVVETTPQSNALKAAPYLVQGLAGLDYLRKGYAMIRALKRAGLPWFRHARGLRVEGGEHADRLCFHAAGIAHSVDCDLLLLHQGVVPNVQMTRVLRAAHEWVETGRYWRPVVDATSQTTVPGVAVAGDGAGIGGALAAACHGELAALGALLRLDGGADAGLRGRLADARRHWRRHMAIRPYLDVLFTPAQGYLAPPDEVIACRCEEVRAGEVRALAVQGCLGPNQLKAFSRAGMGPCQGRYCGLTVSELIADAHGVSPELAGYYRIRNPLKPVTLTEIANID